MLHRKLGILKLDANISDEKLNEFKKEWIKIMSNPGVLHIPIIPASDIVFHKINRVGRESLKREKPKLLTQLKTNFYGKRLFT